MSDPLLQGEKITLKPTTPDDKPLFYEMAAHSDATPHLFQLYDRPVPTQEEMFDDYKDYYFDGSEPEKGRVFFIMSEGEPIGQINYNDIDRTANSVEMDIWIAKESNTSKGSGSDALRTLATYLTGRLGVEHFSINTSPKNERAVRAYEKAGFRIVKRYMDEQGDDVYHLEK